MSEFMRVEDLQAYQKLCQLHLEIDGLVKRWPRHERFELTSQILRSSNSAPANLAEKHSDRHVRNKIEGTNRARGETCRRYTISTLLSSKGILLRILTIVFEIAIWNVSEC
jgi:four helix bundle protein